MPGPEQEPYPQPNELPPDLAEFLRDQEWACLTEATDQGTAYILKLPGREIESARGRVPIGVEHMMILHPLAPVIRTELAIYDQPQSPLVFESYLNIQDPTQYQEFAALAKQEHLLLLFYDETLTQRLAKQVRNGGKDAIPVILARAQEHLASLPADQIDFDTAKEEVMAATSWLPPLWAQPQPGEDLP